MKKQVRTTEDVETVGRPKLSEICSEIFTLILHLRKNVDFGDLEILRTRIRGLLERM